MAKVKHFGDRIVEDLMQAGMSWQREFTPADADLSELEEGVNVEFEHTRDPVISLKITMDHLAEHVSPKDDVDRYYTGLSILEQVLEAGQLDELIALVRALGIKPTLRKLSQKNRARLSVV